jgi:hypothetical protein
LLMTLRRTSYRINKLTVTDMTEVVGRCKE